MELRDIGERLSTLGVSIEASSGPLQLARHLGRPAIEPAVMGAFEMLRHRDGVNLALDRLPRRLTPSSRARVEPAWTTASDARRVVYPAPDERKWRRTVSELLGDRGDAVPCAIVLYACTMLTHPETDGNGRLARALFWLSLMHRGVVPCPVLPLALWQETQSKDLVPALRNLSETLDWTAFRDRVSQSLLNWMATAAKK